MRASLTLRAKPARVFKPPSSQPKPYKPPALRTSSLTTPARSRLRWRVPAALTVFVAAAYLSYRANRQPSGPPPAVAEDVSDRYHASARTFDKQVNLSEKTMLMGFLRARLVRQAAGHVLEVGVGTGRNARYYDVKKCESITMLDQAGEMVEIAREKFKKEHPNYKRARFVTQDAHDRITCPPGGFDTVVQTMGICSTVNPVGLLRHLGAVVKAKEGRVLLLEHGRSYYGWLDGLLDSGAARHADKFGCWWNKDVGKIVEESGLEVVKIKRYHFGTTWLIELRSRQS